LSSIIHSQINDHKAYGGVVPEIAARSHVEMIEGVAARAMAQAGLGYGDLDGVGATAGPGLVGGVMVGLGFGKAVALARGLPFVAVNHLEGHAVSARLGARVDYPFLLLLVSGGHCQLLEVRGIGDMSRLGTTIDDAAGEAFDKIAKEKSTDKASGAEGGDLGWFKKSDMVKEFADAAFDLKKGQTSETPTKTQFGFHIIRVDDVRDAQLPKLDEVKPQISQQLQQQKLAKFQEDLRAKAKVE
jgi:glycoprotease/Kae1 family metallohydrolase